MLNIKFMACNVNSMVFILVAIIVYGVWITKKVSDHQYDLGVKGQGQMCLITNELGVKGRGQICLKPVLPLVTLTTLISLDRGCSHLTQ